MEYKNSKVRIYPTDKTDKTNKSFIGDIKKLPANKPRYFRHSYRFTLKNNQGGGICIADCPPKEIEKELLNQFLGREIESIALLN